MRFFSVDSPLYRFIVRFWDIVKLNFVWLVFSLPIVTTGAATVAAYSVTLKMVDNHEGHVVTQFLKAFKESWKQGIFLGLITLVTAYFIYLNMEFFNKLDNSPVFFLIAAIIIAFFGLVYFTYAFAICARYHNTVINTLKNSASITIKYFVKTLLLWTVIALLIILYMFNTTLMFFGLLIGPVSIFFTVSGFAIRFFKEIEIETQQQQKNNSYTNIN